jgi:transcriptional regulator with XRE-family HTH domain
VAEQRAGLSFGDLLRRLRADGGLTQEQLAELAGLSMRAVSDLERGVNLTARRETTRLLADALGLVGETRAVFEARARGRPSAIALQASRAAAIPLPAGIRSGLPRVFRTRD